VASLYISDASKCGVRNLQGNVVGFVHATRTAKLKTLRTLINEQVLIMLPYTIIYFFILSL